jgi:glycerol-3-phosphate dehydrogenase
MLLEMARERAVDMPIAAAVAALLDEKLSVDEAMQSCRPGRSNRRAKKNLPAARGSLL